MDIWNKYEHIDGYLYGYCDGNIGALPKGPYRSKSFDIGYMEGFEDGRYKEPSEHTEKECLLYKAALNGEVYLLDRYKFEKVLKCRRLSKTRFSKIAGIRTPYLYTLATTKHYKQALPKKRLNQFCEILNCTPNDILMEKGAANYYQQ